jgi:hypothetical protein
MRKRSVAVGNREIRGLLSNEVSWPRVQLCGCASRATQEDDSIIVTEVIHGHAARTRISFVDRR